MSEITRREFLMSMGGVALEASPRQEVTRFKTGSLAGRRFNDLYSKYTGIYGEVPETVEINYKTQLQALWRQKYKKSKNNPVVMKTGQELLEEYGKKGPEKSDIRTYITEIDRIIGDISRNLDWGKYAKVKGLNRREQELAKKLVSTIKGKDLMAYSLTELMPSKDGALNRAVMNFLLTTAGRNYVESIPAIYDPKTSFGPYQFTEYALYEVGGVRRGASLPNAALKNGKIHDSAASLRGSDHHKAAYLFAIDNLTNLVNKATEKQLNVLPKIVNSKHMDIVCYVATAHHGQGAALKIARRWLDNSAKLPYEISCGKVYRKYAEKTKANLRALQ